LESIGVLSSGIAHDLNNLLTPILMSLKLLKEDRSEDERRNLLATLQTSAERGAEVVRQLLTFTGGVDRQRETVQPRLIIQEIKSILEHTIPKTIRISLQLAPDLKLVNADSTQLAQVLMNLCINARDAMPAGGELTIEASNTCLDEALASTRLDARPGSYVRISVVDTGPGIPPETIDRVFDPFFTTKGPGKGTGLGLSTALGIVRAHGGFMDLESEVGKGSRFILCLPALNEAAPPAPEKQPPEPTSGHGELILVVDDESLILETARTTLEERGYRVLVAAGGQEALDVFRKRRGEIQAVLLDMMMPGLDGRATMAALNDLDPKVPIIASSGLGDKGRSTDAAETRRTAFLAKPYTEDEMIQALATVLCDREGER
jgi:CheY-like chemotaxis protein